MEAERVPDGILYYSANLRYPGWKHPVTDMQNRDVGPESRPDYQDITVDRTVLRPRGDENWQKGLTFCWVIPRGHWVISSEDGLGNYLALRQVDSELQPRVLRSWERCTHINPVRDPIMDRGRFDNCPSLNMREHSNVVDPRGPSEVYYWGLGYLSSLTEVVEEDVTSDDDTSSDESDSEEAESDATTTGDDEAPIAVKAIFTCTDIRYR